MSTTIRFTHRNAIDGVRYTWDVRRLWALSAGFPVETVAVADLPGVDENCWFHGDAAPTVRNVVAHVQRILAADMERPIVLNVDGTVMDGLHRVARALLEGRATLPAVRFPSLPPAEYAERV